MHRRVAAARAAEQLVGPVREHLVAVHVVAGAGAGLVHVDDELVAVLAGEHLVGGLHDRVGQLGRRAGRSPCGSARRERLIQITASTNAGSGRRPEIGKFSAARSVWMP